MFEHKYPPRNGQSVLDGCNSPTKWNGWMTSMVHQMVVAASVHQTPSSTTSITLLAYLLAHMELFPSSIHFVSLLVLYLESFSASADVFYSIICFYRTHCKKVINFEKG